MTFERIDPRFNICIPGPERIEQLWTGGRWCEGPAWFGAHRSLVWSDIPNNRMMRYDEISGTTSVFREPANNTNGHTVDRQGRLVSCEHLTRRVTRTEHDGSITVLASTSAVPLTDGWKDGWMTSTVNGEVVWVLSVSRPKRTPESLLTPPLAKIRPTPSASAASLSARTP